MEGESGEMGVIASIIHTCSWRGSWKQWELRAGAGERHCGGHLEGSLSSASPGWGPGVCFVMLAPRVALLTR